ncbi:MAG: sigma 54-interacting transcriptional regulator [Coriobacteriales bacterium]|jgi:transcriptional regulator of acetoin/glycerol metabolism|nr:sigma 54-interacting transcriptional regulator [Coriobacteriales bacterium]
MDLQRLQQNWDDFIHRGHINPDVQPSVAKSWRKCRQYGVDPNGGQGILVSPEVFESIRAANQELIDTAMLVMLSVFDIVADSHFLMVLTDSVGYVLETIGDQAIAEAAEDLRFKPGSQWSDTQVGTNALSVCLDYDVAIQMVGPEHYCVSHQGWVCSAAPIHGLSGEVIGCLNMSGDKAKAHPHTLALVKSAAFGIEQQMLASYNSQLMRANLHRAVNVLSGNHVDHSFADILSGNPDLRGTVAIAERFASYDGTVYLEGEVGTGKELFAQAIHNASSRSDGPFVTINCASIPRISVESELFGSERGATGDAVDEGADGGYPGKLELANRGTVYLEEIAELPLEYQAELLQVLESCTVRRVGALQVKDLDVRIIASSSKNLRSEVEAGHFRGDLLVFINVLRIDLLPLRERPEDILACARRALDYFNERYPESRKTMSDSFVAALQAYCWPGNTKELQNCIERSFYASSGSRLDTDLLEGIISKGGMPIAAGYAGFAAPAHLDPSNNREYYEIINTLKSNDFDVEKSAFSIGMSRASLYRRIKQLQINLKAMRSARRHR